MISHGLKNLQQYLQPFAVALTSKGLTLEPSKIAEPTLFQVVLRGIGKSFQKKMFVNKYLPFVHPTPTYTVSILLFLPCNLIGYQQCDSQIALFSATIASFPQPMRREH